MWQTIPCLHRHLAFAGIAVLYHSSAEVIYAGRIAARIALRALAW